MNIQANTPTNGADRVFLRTLVELILDLLARGHRAEPAAHEDPGRVLETCPDDEL